MSTRTKLARHIAVALGSAAACLIAPAQAQEGGPAQEPLEEIVVTGSLLRQSVSEGSQLITTIGEQDLAATGAGNAVEALVTLAQNQPILNSATSYGAGTGFASYANLRALGSSNTLVLFNGKRIVNNPFQMVGVDLNTIPLNMIERVETLSDGASSVYGSDAIAGVINFIPRRELQGLSIEATRFQPEQAGGERTSVAISGGIGSLSENGWNVYAGYVWHDKERLGLIDRDFSRTTHLPQHGLSRTQNVTEPANWTQGTTGPLAQSQNPSAPNCAPPVVIRADGFFGPNSCAFDFALQADAFPEQTDQSVLVHGALQLGEQLATLEYLRSETDLTSQIGSPIVRGPMSPANPYYPGNGLTPGATGLNAAQNVNVTWRVIELGPQVVNPVTATDRLLAQLDGNLGNWGYSLSALRSTAEVELDLINGFINTQRFRDALLGANGAPFINPFGADSAAGTQFMNDNVVHGLAQSAESTLDVLGAQVNHDLFELPGGAAQFAFAVEYKREAAEFHTNQRAVISEVSVLPVNIDADRDINSATLEVDFPLLRQVDLNVSVRYDDYSDFGDTTNPKAMLTWRPVQSLSLRGSYNEGFRAPTLHNVFAPLSTLDTRNRRADPVLCPGGVPNLALGAVASRDCGATPYKTLVGGNDQLGPETSEAYTFGVQFEPSADFSIGVDYWNYHLFDTIAPLAESGIFADLAQFGSYVVRCSIADPQIAATIPACAPGHSGDPIAYVDQTSQNLGETKTSGVDGNLRWRVDSDRWGSFTFDYRGSYVFDFDFQRVPNGAFFSRAGEYLDGYPVIDYSHYVTLRWELEPVSVQLANRFLAGYRDCNAACATPPLAVVPNDVGSYSVWDLAATFRGFGKATLIARVTNLLDEDPPFTNKTVSLGTGFDERFTDPLGRAYSLTLRYDF
jgi:iron complex outermembrane recepter protein